MSWRALALSLAALALGACSDVVDPTLGTPQAFSLYGYLDPTADHQAIRVVPIVGALDADTLRALAVDVTSVERGTGRSAAWRDSAVDFRDGSVGHVFIADYTPTPGETVEVTVTETDGDRRATAVTVEVPALDRPVVAPALASAIGVTYPIRVQAPRVLAVELVFRVAGLPGALTDSTEVPFADVAPFLDAGGGEWALDLDFVPTARAFLASREVGGARLRLVDVTVRAFVANDAWAVPPGGLDEDRVVEPGTFSNVTGGFGFVGAGYWTEARWTPSLSTQSRAGFVVDVDPASVLTINEVSAAGWVELYNPTLEILPIARYRIAAGDTRASIPDGATIAALGFAVVQVAPRLTGGLVVLESVGGAPLVDADVGPLPDDPDAFTIGSYPDGRSRKVGGLSEYRTADLFRGVLAPTPGAPNRPLSYLAMVNEVFSAGSDGWAEMVTRLGTSGLRVTHDVDLPLEQWVEARREGATWVADETPGRLELDQAGGEVVVVISSSSGPPRVIDVRPYGPQNPTRSSGALPDGDHDAWTPGLLPTRGAPNALPRFAAR